MHQSVVTQFLRHRLFHIGIGTLEGRGFGIVLQCQVFEFGCLAEERIVECDDVALRTVIGVEGADIELCLWRGELLMDIIQEPPVA